MEKTGALSGGVGLARRESLEKRKKSAKIGLKGCFASLKAL
jgi:hypothetical protein